MTGKGLQILTYTRHFMPFSNEVLSVSHLIRHGESLYYGNLRGLGSLLPVAERLAVELSLPVLTI